MSVSAPDCEEVHTCRNCMGTARKQGSGSYPAGWYALTVSVPEWYGTGSGKQYIWLGMFCSVACLLAHGPQLQADADLAHQGIRAGNPGPGRA